MITEGKIALSNNYYVLHAQHKHTGTAQPHHLRAHKGQITILRFSGRDRLGIYSRNVFNIIHQLRYPFITSHAPSWRETKGHYWTITAAETPTAGSQRLNRLFADYRRRLYVHAHSAQWSQSRPFSPAFLCATMPFNAGSCITHWVARGEASGLLLRPKSLLFLGKIKCRSSGWVSRFMTI